MSSLQHNPKAKAPRHDSTVGRFIKVSYLQLPAVNDKRLLALPTVSLTAQSCMHRKDIRSCSVQPGCICSGIRPPSPESLFEVDICLGEHLKQNLIYDQAAAALGPTG